MRTFAIAAILLLIACLGCDDGQAERDRLRDEWIAREKARIDAGETHLAFYSSVNTNVLLDELSGHSRVQQISFQQTQDLDESGLEELSRFPNLRELTFFCEPSLDSRTISHLAACDGLENLSVDVTKLDSAGVKTIATIESLKRLTLRPNAVETFKDEDVASLAALKNLEYLYLGGASPEAIEALRKEFPDCEIVDADESARATGESRFYRQEGASP